MRVRIAKLSDIAQSGQQHSEAIVALASTFT